MGVDGASQSLVGVMPDAVEVAGRIKPDEVWTYVQKLKVSTSKEVVIMRLSPVDDDDEVGYISLFS